MRVFFSVGEPSGDLHASNLIRDLRRRVPQLDAVGFGGPKMQTAGCQILYPLTELAIMFFASAIIRLPQFVRLLRMAGRYLDQHQVDAIVLIDYSGFNWWMAWQGKRRGIPVFYYGVPQMWAWAPWRIRKLKRRVDHVLCKLPFEEPWFRQRGVQATYVGHPYFDELHAHKPDGSWIEVIRSQPGPHLVLLPGSRDSEVARHASLMLQSARWLRERIPDLRVSVACYNDRHRDAIRGQLSDQDGVIECHADRTLDLMQTADACMACSGSASLELMYYGCPTVVIYRIGRLARIVMPWLIRCRYITLVNLIAADDISRPRRSSRGEESHSQPPMPEYVFSDTQPEKICRELLRWLTDPMQREAAAEPLRALADRYARAGATEAAADYLLRTLQPSLAANKSAQAA